MSGASTGNANAAASQASPLAPWLARLRANPLIPLLVAGAAVVAIVAALLMWASAPTYRVLFSNLTEADGGRIIAALEQQGVQYRFSEGGQALLVPGDQVHKLRLQLAEQGLPEGGNVGLDIMEKQAFGVSQFAEQVNFQRGLEGELARSIEALGPVERARVHLALAKPSVFIRDRQPAKGSVVLTLQPGRALGDAQVNAMVHLVASSVPELAPEDVTVVDQSGRLLSRETGPGHDLDRTRLRYTEEVERAYQQRIEKILEPILGRGNVRAQVTAQIDFSRREETEERYGPNQNGNPAAIRSKRINAVYEDPDGGASGIPGALSNTPPGEAASPINNDADGNDDEEDAPPQRVRQDDLINYELDRNVTHTQHHQGSIQRLSVAVVLNYREKTGEDGTVQLAPLSDEELNRITDLARHAMGFSAERGDGLEVVNSPFADLSEPFEERPWWQSPQWVDLALGLGRYLLVALAALLLYRLILRPLIQRYTATPAAPPQPAARGNVSAVVGDDEDDDLDPEEAVARRRRQRRKTLMYESNLKDLQDLARDDPAMVAMILRSWMNRNEPT